MLPYIMNILHYSGTSQNFSSICQKLRQFSVSSELTDEDIKTAAKDALDSAIHMGLVRKNARNNTYDLTHKWFVPESEAFQKRLHDVVREMPDALGETSDQSDAEDFPASSIQQPADCMGPGMAQKRSPAQIRAIAIYRRMREQREREEREAAARARKRRNSGPRSRSRSRSSRGRRSSTGRSRSRSQQRRRSSTRARSRSTSRARSASNRSRRR
ncbi:arginine/serine-rich coiled-coil protein 2-like [Anopheles maculipalpis]|uniref:arginine/serine-rich coiled-coil protein 2-like n=1 Tax=Anopheles maculipalpis TaxID=1496333 RepID=UPI00215994BD|nr:arginine/serine-rich coiled-coil protein 2-like [Anopheles maculipalpis]